MTSAFTHSTCVLHSPHSNDLITLTILHSLDKDYVFPLSMSNRIPNQNQPVEIPTLLEYPTHTYMNNSCSTAPQNRNIFSCHGLKLYYQIMFYYIKIFYNVQSENLYVDGMFFLDISFFLLSFFPSLYEYFYI